jgi:hypothetical protein
MGHGKMRGLFEKGKEPILRSQKTVCRQPVNIHAAFLNLFLQPRLEPPVHRVGNPDLFNLLSAKGLEKIIVEIDIMNAIPSGLQHLLIGLHGSPVKHELFLMKFERGSNSRKKKGLFYQENIPLP